MFTLDPVEEVSVMVFTSTTKERRLVLGGGVSGTAVIVTLSVAALPPPVEFFGEPLQDIRQTANSKISDAKTFPKFTLPPRQCFMPRLMRAKEANNTHAIIT